MTSSFFFFNDTATTEIYTLSLHDALPILGKDDHRGVLRGQRRSLPALGRVEPDDDRHGQGEQHGDARQHQQTRSEEHTSELQSRQYLVCRLLLEKKKKSNIIHEVDIIARL